MTLTNSRMRFLMENRLRNILLCIVISCISVGYAAAQNTVIPGGKILQEFNPMNQQRLDSLNKISRLAAERTLQDAVKRSESGQVTETSWGSALPTENYVPVSDECLKNAESALNRAREIGGTIPSQPNPPHLVNDFTGILTQEQQDLLTIRCNEFANKTSNQVAIVILPTLYGLTRSEAALKIGREWGVGQKSLDNGVVLLVKPKVADEGGEVFIAVGTGLQSVLTDAFTKRIVELRIIPAFKNNDYYNGINDALNIIFPVASGEISSDEFANKEEGDGLFIFKFLLMLFIIWLVIRKHKKNNNMGSGNHRVSDFTTGYVAGNMASSLSRGGFGRSGGSSLGGGGLGGGFGGFGGGGFSGGGAGGSW